MSQPVRVPHQVRRESVGVLVDDSTGSDAAVGWAAREAGRRGLTLTLLQALDVRPEARLGEIHALDHALLLARSSAQRLDVRVRVETTPVWPLVVDASETMASVVLSEAAASAIMQERHAAELSSVKRPAAEASCPVLVVSMGFSGIEIARLGTPVGARRVQ